MKESRQRQATLRARLDAEVHCQHEHTYLPTDDLILDRLPRGLHMIHRFDPPDQFFPLSGLQSHLDLALGSAWLISVLAFPAFVLPPFRHESPLSERSCRVFVCTVLKAISYQIACYLL